MDYFRIREYSFREIQENDLPMLLSWRNSSFIHSKMLTDHKITWDEHKLWFDRIKNDIIKKNFIFSYNDLPLGYQGYSDIDLKNRTCSGGSYIGEREMCPKDAGIFLFFMGIDYAFLKLNIVETHIDVFADNKKALRLNEFLGYEFDLTNGYYIDKNERKQLVYKAVLTKNKWHKRREEVSEMLQIYDVVSMQGGGVI